MDIYYSTLGLCVKNDTGEILVRRNPAGSMFGTGYIIPDGQKTIISLVVQPTGQFVVFANGLQVYANTSTTDVTSLIPGTTQYAGGNAQGAFGTYINVGRNDPDTWTTYNGKIGDVFVYTTALGQADRMQLEADLATKFSVTLPVYHTITASAGTGGSISPTGAYKVADGGSQAFTITPAANYLIHDVLVDGSSVGAVTTYPFTGVTGDHTIAASFIPSLSPYQQWLANNGNLPDTPENLGTYAFGLELTGGASPISVAPNPTTGEFKYTRRKDTGLSFSYESSGTLDIWQPFTPVAPTPTVVGINASLEEVTIQIPADLLANTKLFVRVKVAD